MPARLFAAVVLFASALFAAGTTLAAEAEPAAVTQHQIRLPTGRTLKYEAVAGRVPIRDGASQEAHAWMFYVAYRVPSATPRPVTLLWNGGPGAASAGLALNSIGPRRIDSDGSIIDFPGTALATTDLVFVDAVGTGFSRLAKREYAKEFYSTAAEVSSFSDFVRAWRHLAGAETAPIYVGGQSWGAFRASGVAKTLLSWDVKVSGVVSISGQTGMPHSKQPDETLYALRTVEQAIAAQHHGKLSPAAPKSPAALQREVESWVLETYAPALRRLPALSGAERDAIVAKLSFYTGLPEDQIDRSTLIVTPRHFLNTLMKGEGKSLNLNDMLAFNPPPPQTAAINRYLRDELGYRTDLEYLNESFSRRPGFAPDGQPILAPNAQWDYETAFFLDNKPREERWAWNRVLIARGEPPDGQATPITTEAMALNPDLRVLYVGGRNDSLLSCAAVDEILRRQTPEVRARTAHRCYDGGHSFYTNPATRMAFSADLQAFVRGETPK